MSRESVTCECWVNRDSLLCLIGMGPKLYVMIDQCSSCFAVDSNYLICHPIVCLLMNRYVSISWIAAWNGMLISHISPNLVSQKWIIYLYSKFLKIYRTLRQNCRQFCVFVGAAPHYLRFLQHLNGASTPNGPIERMNPIVIKSSIKQNIPSKPKVMDLMCNGEWNQRSHWTQ